MRPLLARALFPAATLAAVAATAAGEVPAIGRDGFGADARPVLAARTLVVGVEVDRDQARLLHFTVKERLFVAAPLAPERSWRQGDGVQLEVVLRGPGKERFVVRHDVRGLCLEHPGDTPPHVAGDRIWLHRETTLVELPELAGFDRLELAAYDQDAAGAARLELGRDLLDRARFDRSGGALDFADLAIAPPDAPRGGSGAVETSGAVTWPDACPTPYPDPYRVYGDASEVSKRLHIVIVPDGYTCAEKARMETHAQELVDWFRSRTPFREHDRFVNYVLVYAFSAASGTDQCDCDIVVDTAMNTRFPDGGRPCGDSANRCLYYGTGNGGPSCDPQTSSANISAAEARAPARDATVIMVNTDRYGGCGGDRAVYSAGARNGADIALHELGHSLALLDDEYQGDASCGSLPGGTHVNTSENASSGNWPEWIADIGAPAEGAHYYNRCIYRPWPQGRDCEMRSLVASFCPVCNQQWALTYFNHPRVRPTAPVEAQSPPSPATATVGQPADFSVATRLAQGPSVGNGFTWKLQGPGYPTPTTIATAGPDLQHAFAQAGSYTLTCEVVADTNFIKPVKNDGNVDTATWTVTATEASCDPDPVFAGLAAALDLDPCQATGVEVSWSPATFGPAGGSYRVLRDAVVVASGLAASPYVDLPGDGLSHDYRVEAASADCERTAGNAVTAAAVDATGTAPGFAGVRQAADRDACARTGIEVGWDPAGFGPEGGSYEVWRDGVPVATGVAAPPFVDLPGDGASHEYVVVAAGGCGLSSGATASAAAVDATGTAPSFAGVRQAVDRDACARTGIEVGWDPAAFGPEGGSYEVWRDGVPVATGVAAPPFIDLPGDGASHEYVVVAAGGCGLSSGATVTAAVADIDRSGPVEPLGNVLRAVRAGDAGRFTWSDVALADGYDLGESTAVDFSAPATVGSAVSGSIGVEAGTDLAGPGLRSYRVRQRRCGQLSGF